MNKFLCIHGHFYQPPRENPWTEEIELQASASPYHDWNERICAECYEPNGNARVLDTRHRITDIVNNYSLISFNFGPTLLDWLECKAPGVYERILQADRESLNQWGHGNAIAQAYNHMILPLASRRDLETQIIWGIEDFRFRFNRYPEAMWLPETAVNYQTLDALHRHGMKFLILAPSQAERIRKLDDDTWIDVGNGTIDPRRPYRCYLMGENEEKSRDRFIDIFFYDGALAAGISFGDLLVDGARFAERLDSAYSAADPAPQLIHAAADGETFGHHKKFGDMALAYVLRRAGTYGFELINYGAFLERFSPQWEAELKRGVHDEGTAWSCIHGVGRWKQDCGCRVADHPGWNQRWRKPLREAMDGLRDRLATVFESEGKKYFTDCASARNAYIRVVLQRTDEELDRFFENQCSAEVAPADRVSALQLLEMQRHGMLMYTSCGWFFNELSGLEATQIIQYADRAMQLAAVIAPDDLEAAFVEKLAEASSNIPGYGTGRDIFYRLVRPCRVSMQKVLNHIVIAAAFHGNAAQHYTMYCYCIDLLEHEQKSFGTVTLHVGRAQVMSLMTRETQEFFYALERSGGHACRSVIRRIMKGMDVSRTREEFFERCAAAPERLFPLMREFFGDEYYSLRDIFYEERQRILRQVLTKELDSYGDIYARMYDETRQTVEAAINEGLVAPWEFKKAAENTLSKRLQHALERLRDGLHDEAEREKIRQILAEARDFCYHLDLAPSLRLLQEILLEQLILLQEEFCGAHSDDMQDVVEYVHAARIEEINDFLDFINSLPLELNRTASQNILFRILMEKLPALRQRADSSNGKARELVESLCLLAEKLDFSTDCVAFQEKTGGQYS